MPAQSAIATRTAPAGYAPRRPAASRSARLGLRTTPQQEAVLRRAAEVAHKSLTDFILDSACRAAEQTLLDQRLLMVSGEAYSAFAGLLERPARHNPGLRDLFARPALRKI